MFKLVKKEHYKKGTHGKVFVITYSISEIVMGFMLIILVGFFIYNYLDYNLNNRAAAISYGRYVDPGTTSKTPVDKAQTKPAVKK